MKQKKIVMTGGNGRFAQVFKKIKKKEKIFYPSKQVLNLKNITSIKKYIKKIRPDYLIHCAALSRPMDIHEKNIQESISTNIIGTSNIVKVCSQENVKLIYFSTNYVYAGTKGDYKESDSVLPINKYALSKLGGECAVQMYENSLILRICMTEKPFVHKYAFKNFMTNFIFHDEVAKFLPKLFKYKGIINVGGPIKNVYDFAKKYNSKIKGKYIQRSKTTINRLKPSMNISRLKKIIND